MLIQGRQSVSHFWLKVFLTLLSSCVAGIGFVSGSAKAAEDGDFSIIASVQKRSGGIDGQQQRVPQRNPLNGDVVGC